MKQIETVRLSSAIGLAALLTTPLNVPLPRPVEAEGLQVVLYIASRPEATDAGFVKFSAAMKRPQTFSGARMRIHHIVAAAGDPESKSMTLRSAMSLQPSIVLAPSGNAALAAKNVFGSTPIIFSSYLDPLSAGLAQSASVPGGTATGVSVGDWLDEKRLELLLEAIGSAQRIAVLTDQSWVANYDGEARMSKVAGRLGIQIEVLVAETVSQVNSLMRSTKAESIDAWYLPPTYLADIALDEILVNLRRLKKIGMFSSAEEVQRGAPMSYAQDTTFVWDTLADLTARVLNGEDPGTIPIERPRRYILSVRTGPETNAPPISPAVIRRADRIY